MARLFGTDGVRGLANTELGCELCVKLGRAAAYVLTKHTHHRPKILIGRDTRLSGEMLQAALCAGLCSFGADVHLLGVVPTPAVAYLVVLDDAGDIPLASGDRVGTIHRCEQAVEDYVSHLVSVADVRFDGLRVLIDCANGSASATAHRIFPALGADAEIICSEPDGVNINRDCGSMHIDALARRVKGAGYDLGIAFDGDSDRILTCDGDGNVVDGDMLMAAFACYMKAQGTLADDTLVVTVMSNLGLVRCAQQNGIRIETTKVGDRFVLECMLQNGFALGGEQSGHLIFQQHATTGDGQLSAVLLLAMMKKTGKTLRELTSVMTVYPQVMENVTVGKTAKGMLGSDKDIARLIQEWEHKLGDNGRILVRASGTEPLVRVMAEGKDQELITRCVKQIADAVRAL